MLNFILMYKIKVSKLNNVYEDNNTACMVNMVVVSGIFSAETFDVFIS